MRISAVCVFCGSNPGAKPVYTESALALGRELARQGIELVYGGANNGLMGSLADTVLAGGGRVVGIIPERLMQREVAHTGLTELHVVESMHERKAGMAGRADGFVALPGGLGTLEEICETLTWSQLGIQEKPCAFLNVDGYYEHMRAHFDRMVEMKFLKPEHRSMIIFEDDPARLLDRLRSYVHPRVGKWLDRKDA
jgi:uncharacterized protein (TIGR00730 family)